ncbi:MAG: integrase arm-type DNA-binding domain-containing protein [Candidatus Sedimenticola endophacoides]
MSQNLSRGSDTLDKNQIKKSDGNGLFLLVKSNGSKLWRLRYKYAGKHQEMALGKYPTVPLSEARKMTEEARMLLLQGINPMAERKERKKAATPEDRAFSVIALKWWEQQYDSWTPEHAVRIKRWITEDAKALGELAIDQIDAGHITELMLAIEAAGTPKKAPVILSVINRIVGYALAHRLTRTNPAQGLPLRDILKPIVDGGQKPRIFGEYPVPAGAAPAKTKGGPPAMENDIGIEVG